MQRREFITLLGGGAAVAWPLAARAQQADRVRLIGVLMGGYLPADPEGQTYLGAFLNTLQGLGWTAGRNVRIEVRWMGDDVERQKTYAAELVALAPEVIFCSTTPVVAEISRDSHDPDRVRPGGRSGQRRFRHQHGATGR